MKRKILSICLLILAVCVNAQKWEKTEFKGDALAGTASYTAYSFENSMGLSFTFWSNNEKEYRLSSAKKNFSVERTQMGSYMTKEIIVGFYDVNGNLVEKGKTWLICDKEDWARAEPQAASKKLGKKIITYLQTQTGYVRFLAELYGDVAHGFDLSVPCLNTPVSSIKQ